MTLYDEYLGRRFMLYQHIFELQSTYQCHIVQLARSLGLHLTSYISNIIPVQDTFAYASVHIQFHLSYTIHRIDTTDLHTAEHFYLQLRHEHFSNFGTF